MRVGCCLGAMEHNSGLQESLNTIGSLWLGLKESSSELYQLIVYAGGRIRIVVLKEQLQL